MMDLHIIALCLLIVIVSCQAAGPISERRRKGEKNEMKQSSNRARMFIRFRKALGGTSDGARILFRFRKSFEPEDEQAGVLTVCKLIPGKENTKKPTVLVVCQVPEVDTEQQATGIERKSGLLEKPHTEPHIRFGRTFGKPSFVRFGRQQPSYPNAINVRFGRAGNKPFLRLGRNPKDDLAQVVRFGRSKSLIDNRNTRNRPYLRVGK